jgi:hypothetical protein
MLNVVVPSLPFNETPNTMQRILTEGEGSVRLTSLYKLVMISYFFAVFFNKTSFLNMEVNRTESFPLLRFLWTISYYLRLTKDTRQFEI